MTQPEPDGGSYFLSFNPRAGARFEFTFASRDVRNHYKLAYDPAGGFSLLKLIAGTTRPLAEAKNVPAFSSVGVWLRPWEIRVEIDNRTVLTSDDTSFRAGNASLFPPAVGAVLRQKASIALADDFEDHASTAKHWKTLAGSWKIFAPMDELALRDEGPPMFSVYEAGGDAMSLAIAGETCSNIRISASIRLEGAETAGIAFNLFNKDRFSALVITPGVDGAGRARLLEFRDGNPIELCGFDSRGIEHGQWCELTVETFGDLAWCSVNGQTVCTARPSPESTSSGRIGLVSFGPGTKFDDVAVHGFTGFIDRFHSAGPQFWTLTGDWNYANGLAGSGRALFRPRAEKPGRIDASIGGGCTEAAIFTHSPTENSYYAFGLFGGEWQFRRVLNAVPAVLATAPAINDKPQRITLIDRAGTFECLVDDVPVFDASDSLLPAASCGLMGKEAAFSAFRATEAPPRGVVIFTTGFETVTGIDRILAHKRRILGGIMDPEGLGWEYNKHDGKTVLRGRASAGVLSFHSPIPGSASIEARMSVSGKPALVLDADAGRGAYRLGPSADGSKVVMTRNGIALGERPVTGQPANLLLKLARCGRSILAYEDSQIIFVYADKNPRKAGRVGLASEGGWFESLAIRAEKAVELGFERVSGQWREAGGRWLLNAGLPDPELGHWITGIADEKPAFLWQRTPRPGGFVCYATIAPATEGYADGGSRKFPLGDVVLKFGGDRENTKNGCTLVLWAGGRSVMRFENNGAAAAETNIDLPRDRPVRLGVDVDGKAIKVSANGKPVAEFAAVLSGEGCLGFGVIGSRASFVDILILPGD